MRDPTLTAVLLDIDGRGQARPAMRTEAVVAVGAGLARALVPAPVEDPRSG